MIRALSLRARRRCTLGLGVGLLWWACWGGLCAPAWAAVDALALKAAVVYRLMLFTEWPADAMPAMGAALVLCVDAASPLAAPLNSLRGQPVGPWWLDVRETWADGGLRRCQALFVDGDSAKLAQTLRQPGAQALPLLVVGDEASAEDVAVVRLTLREGRLGFDIDLARAHRRGLKLSSKLLRLAWTVRE